MTFSLTKREAETLVRMCEQVACNADGDTREERAHVRRVAKLGCRLHALGIQFIPIQCAQIVREGLPALRA